MSSNAKNVLFTCIQWNMYVYINGAAVPEGTGFQVNTAAADERMQPADTRLWNWKLHRLGNRATHFHSSSSLALSSQHEDIE
jgi:hypothetical protein